MEIMCCSSRQENAETSIYKKMMKLKWWKNGQTKEYAISSYNQREKAKPKMTVKRTIHK